MKETKFFKYETIADGVTLIVGKAMENCYLVEGEKEALLIDTLSGCGNLKAFVHELTDLPVCVINTHGHVDHCGGNFDFGKCLIHPDDVAVFYRMGDVEQRKGYTDMMLKAFGAKESQVTDYTPPCPIQTLPLKDGDVFDLGGKHVEVISVPGHTKGTVVLLLQEQRIIFSGDAVNSYTFLFLPESTTIPIYKESLIYLNTFRERFDGMYGGHGLGLVPASIVDEAIELCDEIIAGTDDAIPFEFVGLPGLIAKEMSNNKRVDGKLANIIYQVPNE